MLNDVNVLSIGGKSDTTASNSILLPLNKKDRVWIELTRGKLVEPYHSRDSYPHYGPKESGYTSFIGYLIGEISQEDITDVENFDDGRFDYDDIYNEDNNHLTNYYPHEYYPSNPDNQIDNQLIVIDTQRFPLNVNFDLRLDLVH